MTKAMLQELSSLVKEVQAVATKNDDSVEGGPEKGELSQVEKDAVTVATGRVWDVCDTVVDAAANGVVGFVVRRVEQWRDLVRDALQEIEEWDPDEEGDEFFDELLSDDGNGESQVDDDGDDVSDEGEKESNAALHDRKKSTLRILKPVAQIYPAIIINRLRKAPRAVASSREQDGVLDEEPEAYTGAC